MPRLIAWLPSATKLSLRGTNLTRLPAGLEHWRALEAQHPNAAEEGWPLPRYEDDLSLFEIPLRALRELFTTLRIPDFRYLLAAQLGTFMLGARLLPVSGPPGAGKSTLMATITLSFFTDLQH